MTATLRLVLPKTIAILIFIAAASLLIHPVFAQDATSSTTRREKLQQKVETRKENTLQRVEAKKDKMESRVTAMREKMATREAALKAKLDAFKDRRKAEIADRVNTSLNRINQKHTEQMQKHLDKMSALLDKLEARVNLGSADVKDPASAKDAITAARATIATASAAVFAQAEKDYTLQVTTESKVRTEAQAKRDQLHADLQAVRKLVIDAKQSVSNAIRVAKSGPVPVGTGLKEGTPSGQ